MTTAIFPLATLANANESDSDILKLRTLAPEYKQFHILQTHHILAHKKI